MTTATGSVAQTAASQPMAVPPQAVQFEESSKLPVQPDDCVTQGAVYHQVNPWVVRAILKVESNFNPKAVNRNLNGSVDVGMAQINSIHFKELGKFGVGPSDLLNACVSSYVAAWHLKKQIAAYGNSWFAVGAYNSATPCFNRRYSGLVWNTLLGWRVIQGSRVSVQSIESCRAGKNPVAKPAAVPSISVAFDHDPGRTQ
jgi:soluble lytic murein transglycosylase-like protein